MGSVASAVGGLLGGGGGGGTQAVGANITNPVTKEQQDAAMQGATNGLNSQQAFLQAVQAQNGLQNQSNVFNQLQGVANGTGPNPAQAQLAQATAANTANQASLMAGQRGASANPALMARQAAMQGAANQQNAIGQGASLQAQQSLGALGQMGGMANEQAQQLAGATGANTQANLQNQQQMLGAQQGFNQAQIQNQQMVNQVNENNAGRQANMIGNLMGAAGTGAGMFFGGPVGAALGNKIGGWITGGGGTPEGVKAAGGGGGGGGGAPAMQNGFAQGGEIKGPKSLAGKHMLAKGGSVPALVSPGEKYLSPEALKQVEAGAKPMQVGEQIPGKPKVGGAKNSYRNDVIPKTLEAGGVVLPRSVTKSANPDKKAEAFVQAVLARHGKSLKKK